MSDNVDRIIDLIDRGLIEGHGQRTYEPIVDVVGEGCWRCETHPATTDVGLCNYCAAVLKREEMTPASPAGTIVGVEHRDGQRFFLRRCADDIEAVPFGTDRTELDIALTNFVNALRDAMRPLIDLMVRLNDALERFTRTPAGRRLGFTTTPTFETVDRFDDTRHAIAARVGPGAFERVGATITSQSDAFRSTFAGQVAGLGHAYDAELAHALERSEWRARFAALGHHVTDAELDDTPAREAHYRRLIEGCP